MLLCVRCDNICDVCVTLQNGEPTPVSTGYLEVQIVGGKLLHSRKVTASMYIR